MIASAFAAAGAPVSPDQIRIAYPAALGLEGFRAQQVARAASRTGTQGGKVGRDKAKWRRDGRKQRRIRRIRWRRHLLMRPRLQLSLILCLLVGCHAFPQWKRRPSHPEPAPNTSPMSQLEFHFQR